MNQLIVAMDSSCGIGYKGKIPWYFPQDLKHFRRQTLGKAIVMGRKTVEGLPPLKHRKVICLTRGSPDVSEWKNEVTVVRSLDDISEPVVIAGGAEVYRTALERPGYIDKIYLTMIRGEFKSDTFFDLEWLRDFVIVESEQTDCGSFLTLERRTNTEHQYLQLLRNLLKNGIPREGRNGKTLSLFTNHFKFDLRQGFPLLTTKRMFLRGILEEFLFFLRGDTDTTSLSESKVRIWEGNTSESFIKSLGLPYAKGVMGPMYGYQWRFFGKPYVINKEGRPCPNEYDSKSDQLAKIVRLIKTEPNSRRILMTSYNPTQAEEGVLYPCHSIVIQFYVQDNYLDMFCYNRSQDTFLGVPYNIASSALLLSVVACLTKKTPRFLNMTMGDTHLYDNHIPQAHQQIGRIPFKFPSLKIPNITSIADIPKLKASDFALKNYRHHPTIKGVMIV